MDKYLKSKKMWNLVVSKQENHNWRRETPIKIELYFTRKKKHSFFADTKLQTVQIRRKMEANFNKSIFI